MDWPSIILGAVFFLGGATMLLIGYHAGFKAGEERELERSARRFHEFRLQKFERMDE